jgi:hypothetical protein
VGKQTFNPSPASSLLSSPPRRHLLGASVGLRLTPLLTAFHLIVITLVGILLQYTALVGI